MTDLNQRVGARLPAQVRTAGTVPRLPILLCGLICSPLRPGALGLPTGPLRGSAVALLHRDQNATGLTRQIAAKVVDYGRQPLPDTSSPQGTPCAPLRQPSKLGPSIRTQIASPLYRKLRE